MNIKYYIGIMVVCFATAQGNAQVPGDSAKKWHFLLEPYFMFMSSKGTAGLGNSPGADFSQSPGDIFDQLQGSAMLYMEMHSKNWAITSDLLYLGQSWDVKPDADINSGTVEVNKINWEVGVLNRLLPWLEGGLGLQFKSIKIDAYLIENTAAGPVSKSYGLTRSWIDPVIITRATFPVGKRWLLTARGNMGGYVSGSKFTWQAGAFAHFNMSKLVVFSAGYRAFYVHYDEGLDSERFLYKVTTFGPVLGFGFRF